jgi:hypothetical protein
VIRPVMSDSNMRWSDVEAHRRELLEQAAEYRLAKSAQQISERQRFGASSKAMPLYLRIWWASRPRRRELYCLVAGDDGLALLTSQSSRRGAV